MELLRNKSRLTMLQMLLEMVLHHPGDQRTIASAVGVTPQAVSEYLRKMESEGLVDLSEKAPRVTINGVDLLQSSLLQLKEFVDTSIGKLSIVRTTDAISSVGLKEGQDVGLFMKDGLLYAGEQNGRRSLGRADHDALKGEMVSVSELSGVLELPPPTLYLLNITPARQGGGGERIDRGKLDIFFTSRGEKRPRSAVLDLEAASLMQRSRIPYDMEMPGPETMINHLERGISVICIGTPYSVSRMTRRISMGSLDLAMVDMDLEGLLER
ncbi:MAG: helix-turn-helix domain-containing protein [Candidatus Thermoplasmatota archaeon]|nr:helix-turn-helix domain-containing protein [Candidatus Thermoplasmatota archaeon]